MRYNFYTDQSPKVSEIGFGAWQLGKSRAWSAMTENDAISLVHEALDLGVNFFDTAPNYGLGESERILGIALKKSDRSKIVISTKFGHSNAGKTNFDSGFIRESLEGSLRRLKTDYVDSILMHNPDKSYFDGNKNDHYEIFEKLKDEGKILAYGASLDTSEDIQKFISNTNGKVIEAFFNIFHQDSKDSFDLAIKNKVSIIAKIPLDSGWLSGKYNVDSTFDGVRGRWSAEDIKFRSSLVDKLKRLSVEGDTLSQSAIAFCLAYKAVSNVIPGNKNIIQLKENIKSSEHNLSATSIEKLEKFYVDEIKDKNLPW